MHLSFVFLPSVYTISGRYGTTSVNLKEERVVSSDARGEEDGIFQQKQRGFSDWYRFNSFYWYNVICVLLSGLGICCAPAHRCACVGPEVLMIPS